MATQFEIDNALMAGAALNNKGQTRVSGHDGRPLMPNKGTVTANLLTVSSWPNSAISTAIFKLDSHRDVPTDSRLIPLANPPGF
jgi:hypothetical protein